MEQECLKFSVMYKDEYVKRNLSRRHDFTVKLLNMRTQPWESALTEYLNIFFGKTNKRVRNEDLVIIRSLWVFMLKNITEKIRLLKSKSPKFLIMFLRKRDGSNWENWKFSKLQ